MSKPLNIFVPHCSDLLTDHLPHGDGLIAHGFLTHLARRGHRLHVAAQRVEVREPLHPNISVHLIRTTSSGKLFSRMEYMLRVRRLFRALHRKNRFDLIHQLNPVFTGISLSLVGSGLPLVLGTYVARWPDDPDSIASQGTWVSRILAGARDAISEIQQRSADALVLTTPAALNRLPRPGAVGDRIHMLPHGLDVDFFSPAPRWDSPAHLLAEPENLSVLFFANVVARKGIFTLLEAFAEVAREIPACRLRIAGDGPALAEAKLRAAALNCSQRIEFLGRQERSAAPQLYRDCSVYCLPSYGEPYATTVLEAMSCGKPVVVTDAGGLPYMVPDGGGKKVGVADSAALAQALIELLRKPQQRVAMGRHNRELVKRTMSWEHVAAQLEDIYFQTLLQRVSSRRHAARPAEAVSLDRSSRGAVQERA